MNMQWSVVPVHAKGLSAKEKKKSSTFTLYSPVLHSALNLQYLIFTIKIVFASVLP